MGVMGMSSSYGYPMPVAPRREQLEDNMMKNNRWFILAVASLAALLLPLAAFATQIPSLPVALPGVRVPVTLPGRSLPGAFNAAIGLPVVRMPVVAINQGVRLPGPANPLPLRPNAVFTGVKQFTGAAEPKKEPIKGEKLDELFDRGVKKEPAVRDGSIYKIPETDLLTDIGIE